MPTNLKEKQIKAYGVTREEVPYKEWYKRLLRKLHIIKPNYEVISLDVPIVLSWEDIKPYNKTRNFEIIKQSRTERPISNDK